jgi:hypothetical protein
MRHRRIGGSHRIAHPLGRATADAQALRHLVQGQPLGAAGHHPGHLEQSRAFFLPHDSTRPFLT